MKKMLAIVLTVLMVCSLASPAWAAVTKTPATTDEVLTLDWEDVSALAGDEDGDFYTFDNVAVMIWIPKELESIELDEEDLEAGFIGYFYDEEDDYTISVVLSDVGVESLEEWKTVLEDEMGITDIGDCIINGYEAVMYSDEEEDYFCVDFIMESGNLLEFTFAPYSDDDFFAGSTVIISSIQPLEE